MTRCCEFQELVDQIGALGPEMWPNENMLRLMGSLCEETGEVARAITKRDAGYKKTHEEWTENLRLEIGQTLITLICMANREGFDLDQAAWDAWMDLIARPPEELDGPPKAV